MKKIAEELDYYQQQSKNEFAFRQMLKTVKPDLYVLFDILDKTKVNPFVVWKIIRALNNIAIGNGYGTISVEIQKGVVLFVRGEESDRVGEPILLKKDE